MNILVNLLLGLAGFFAILLLLALFMRKDHYVIREIKINAPKQRVFDFLKLLKNQDKFNNRAMVSPDRKREYKGTDGTIGFIYSWHGDKKAGVGEKEILNIIEGKRIETEIRFVKPMVSTAKINMETESVSENETKVLLSNGGRLNYPLNIFIPLFEKMFAKDMDSSLQNLKRLLENS